MASLREKMKFGGRDGRTSQDTTKDLLAASFEDTRLPNSHGIPNGRNAGATFEGSHKNSVESQVPEPSAGGGQRKGVQPHTARKIARNAAVLGAMVLAPVQCLMNQISQATDFIEVACAPTSSLTASMESLGHSAYRINYRNGFDLDKKEGTTKLAQYVQEHVPRHGWVSLPCTRLSSLTNLTQRDEVEQANFQKRQGRDLKRAGEVVDAMEPILESDGDLSWEWPTGATKGWKSRAIRKLGAFGTKTWQAFVLGSFSWLCFRTYMAKSSSDEEMDGGDYQSPRLVSTSTEMPRSPTACALSWTSCSGVIILSSSNGECSDKSYNCFLGLGLVVAIWTPCRRGIQCSLLSPLPMVVPFLPSTSAGDWPSTDDLQLCELATFEP